jgi:hypothetical protein
MGSGGVGVVQQKGSLFEELERHMHRGGGDAGTARNIQTQAVAQNSIAYQAPDRCEPAGSGSGGSSTTTNQNSNSGSNSASDDDGRLCSYMLACSSCHAGLELSRTRTSSELSTLACLQLCHLVASQDTLDSRLRSATRLYH